MSFMFNPHPYDDFAAINRPKLSRETNDSSIVGTVASAKKISTAIQEKLEKKNSVIVALDGYAGTNPCQTVNLLTQDLALKGITVISIDIAGAYKSSEELEMMFSDLLPMDKERDPVLMYGKLFQGKFDSLFNMGALVDLKTNIENQKTSESRNVIIVYGCGSAIMQLQEIYDLIVYFDITPKQFVLRAKSGLVKNLGDSRVRPFKELMRRCYYIDFEVTAALRGQLINNDKVDFYIASDDSANLKLLPKKAFNEIMSSLAKYPFRCKPVYIEGVWGGEYVRNIRNLPSSMKNAAWVFDLIPLEVSILVQNGDNLLEFPFFTFVQKEGNAIMGKEATEKFDGYFPIRFNYDDTFHSSGNMSIQVHPGEAYAKENYNELGRQDESYYIVATGHGAKTYVGFNENCDPDQFIKEIKQSEVDFTEVDYQKYVNAASSQPGTQFMIPAGTIHASGRNQLILEIGSLTVGSYTYKLYDYLRADLDGKPRPIHTYDGERVLDKNRKTNWVNENIVQNPRIVRSGYGWSESIIGEHELVYFSLRRFEFDKEIEDDTNGKFHVLVLVDGERVLIQSLDNPDFSYTASYLDVVVVPANIGRYKVTALGDHPIIMHKTMLKDGFYES